MKRKLQLVLLALVVLLCGAAAAQEEWIPVEIISPLSAVPDWNEPDSSLLIMARADGLIYFEDINAPLQEFLQKRARCIFISIRPSQLMQRLAWVTELDLSPYAGTLEDARWLWMFEGLTKITLTDAALTDLSIISGFTALEELTLINCGFFDLVPLVNCKNLAALTLGWSDEYKATSEEFDLTPLTKLKSLKSLALYGSGIRSLTPLSSVSRRFRALTLSNTAIEDFVPLKNFLNMNTLTLDLLDSSPTAEIMRACPRGIKSLTLKRIILDEEAEDAVKRFNRLSDYALIDCDASNPLFYETLNKAARLTLQSISLPDGGYIGEVYADKTTMLLRDVPEAVMISVLSTRSSNLASLSIDIEALTENLTAALQKKTSLNKVTINLKADLDLSGDVWKRISGIRELTIASKGKTLENMEFLSALTRINTLTLSGVAVEDTAGIAYLDRLTQLNVYGCRISDWSFLENLKGLNIVKIYGSELENDVLPWFAGMRWLDDLRLDGNRITDLTALVSSQAIRKLSILNNPIEDYMVLLDMPAMRTVFLDEGGIITGNYILARSKYIDDVDYEAIYQDAFGTKSTQEE